MRARHTRHIHLAIASLITILTACTHPHPHAAHTIKIEPPPPPTTTTTSDPPMTTTTTIHEPLKTQPDWNQLARLAFITNAESEKLRLAADALARQPQPTQQKNSVASQRSPSTASYGNLTSVVNCIKNAESGNYTEHSHPGSGSGAYQYIPGTWQTWSARAGYPGYTYAYLAPPNVQDAVLIYTLTHGGAGNWSNKFGRDGCTSGLPGGG